jgi:hypothetical protein
MATDEDDGARPDDRGAPPAQWARDPSGRHVFRYWNGSEWTGHWADHGPPRTAPVDVAVGERDGAPATSLTRRERRRGAHRGRLRRRRFVAAAAGALAVLAAVGIAAAATSGGDGETSPTAGGGASTEVNESPDAVSITIVNDAHDTQNFAFGTKGDGLRDFRLDDDSDRKLSNTRTFRGLAAGTYTITEGALPAWKLHDLACSTPQGVDLAKRRVRLTLSAGEDVTCTFTNAAARPLVGAIRWDAWADGQPGRAVEYTLGPSEWRDRLPWYAKEIGPDTVEIRADNQKVADAEIAHAADLGVDYFAFVWYNAREGGGDEPMTRGLRLYRTSARRDLVKYTVIIKPEHLIDPVQSADVLGYMRDPNWVKVDGRPLIFVGMAEVSSRELIDGFRAGSVAQGTGDPYIVYIAGGGVRINQAVTYADSYGFDAVSAYAVSGGSSQGDAYADLTVKTRDTWDFIASNGTATVPTVMAGWDPRPRVARPPYWGDSGDGWYHQAAPDELEAHFREAMEWSRDHASKAVLVYAWNEYDEGGWIGPTLVEDEERLHAVRDALTSAASTPSTSQPPTSQPAATAKGP